MNIKHVTLHKKTQIVELEYSVKDHHPKNSFVKEIQLSDKQFKKYKKMTDTELKKHFQLIIHNIHL